MTQAKYIETVQDGETRETYDVFLLRLPRATTATLEATDLSSGTAPSAGDSRAVARPIVGEIQAAVADGRLGLP